MELKVLSHYHFDEEMKKMCFNDDNVESQNMAFISIVGTPECLNYYLDEGDTKHYFKDHQNVLNLDFDDIGDDVMYNGHLFKTITMEQAEISVNFIDDILDKGVDVIYVHCRAGMSRSRAFAEFIYRVCRDKNIDVIYSDRNDYTTMYNYGVLSRLNHAYWKKHRLMQYEDENMDYPDELVKTPVRVINRQRTREAWRLNNKKNI
jgi:hypothetical protein